MGILRADNGIVSLAPSARITEAEQRPDTAQDVDLFHFTLEAFSELLQPVNPHTISAFPEKPVY